MLSFCYLRNVQMKMADNEEIQLIWDEINALAPEEREKEYARFEKRQPDIVQFMSEELEGLDPVYLEKGTQWQYFLFKAVKAAHNRKRKMSKIKLNMLHDIIEDIQGQVGPDEVDEYCENIGNPLLSHILDLISHLEEEKPRKSSSELSTDSDEEITDIENTYETQGYDEYDLDDSEEGDEDYVMFREMYDERGDGEYDEDEMSDHEYAQYVMFLMFKSVMDALEKKLKQAEESRRMRAAKKSGKNKNSDKGKKSRTKTRRRKSKKKMG